MATTVPYLTRLPGHGVLEARGKGPRTVLAFSQATTIASLPDAVSGAEQHTSQARRRHFTTFLNSSAILRRITPASHIQYISVRYPALCHWDISGD